MPGISLGYYPYPTLGQLGYGIPYPTQGSGTLGIRIKVYPGIGYGPGTTRVEYPGRSGNTLYTLPNVPDPWVTYSIPYPRVGYIGYQNQSLPGYRVRPGYYPGRLGNTLYTLPNVPDPWVTYSIIYPRVGYVG